MAYITVESTPGALVYANYYFFRRSVLKRCTSEIRDVIPECAA